jgi:hypothetical protein
MNWRRDRGAIVRVLGVVMVISLLGSFFVLPIGKIIFANCQQICAPRRKKPQDPPEKYAVSQRANAVASIVVT